MPTAVFNRFNTGAAKADRELAFRHVQSTLLGADIAARCGDAATASDTLKSIFVAVDTRPEGQKIPPFSISHMSSPHEVLASHDAHRASRQLVEPAVAIAQRIGDGDMVKRLRTLEAADLTDTYLSNSTRPPLTDEQKWQRWGDQQEAEIAGGKFTVAYD